MTKIFIHELQDLSLKKLNYAIPRYDPFGKFKVIMLVSYEGHIPVLEDFWVGIQDSLESRQRGFYRLTMVQMKEFDIEDDITKDFKDDGELLDPSCRNDDR